MNETPRSPLQIRQDIIANGQLDCTFRKAEGYDARFNQRYDVWVDGRRIGWVVKVGAEWEGFAKNGDSVIGFRTGTERTRQYAADEVGMAYGRLNLHHPLTADEAVEAMFKRLGIEA